MEPNVRDATEADLPAIVDIYNQSIPGAWSTADTTPVTVADRIEWFRKHDPARRPLWVAELDGGLPSWYAIPLFQGMPGLLPWTQHGFWGSDGYYHPLP